MFAGLNTNTNYSLYAVPAAFGLAIAPHFYAVAIINTQKAPGRSGFDFSFPKRSREKIADAGLTPELQDRYLRAEAANDNSFAALPLFAAAVVAGNLARLPTKTLNTTVGVYLAARVAFNALYIYGTNNAAGIGRSVAWFTSMCAALSLYWKAAGRFADL